jgi:hypothetical protein
MARRTINVNQIAGSLGTENVDTLVVGTAFRPSADNSITVGDATHRWATVYSQQFHGGANNINLQTNSGLAVVINNDGSDVDFRTESDTNVNHFVSDAGLFAGVGAFAFGSAATTLSYCKIAPPALTSAAGAVYRHLTVTPAGSVTIGTGTAATCSSLVVDEPDITLNGNTVTHASTFIVSGAPTEGTRNSAVNIVSGSVVINDTGAALAQGATSGWLGVPGVATGIPNGTPAGQQTGCYPMFYDTVGNRLCVYNGSWRSVALA